MVNIYSPDKVVIDNNNYDFISLDEGRKRIKENIYNAIKSRDRLTLIKAQTGIGKTHAYREIIADTYMERRYIIALRLIMMLLNNIIQIV